MPRRFTGVETAEEGFRVLLDGGVAVGAGAIVVATGVQYRRLPLPRLEHFEGAGISYAATELEARHMRGRDAIVVGGGNSAGQAAMFLSRSARLVRLVARGSSLAASMSDYLVERIRRNPGISIHFDSEVVALHGADVLEAVDLARAGAVERVDAAGLFVMVGAALNTGWLSGLVELDPKGFVVTADGYETSRAGIYAVGDVRAGSVKRVASAVGEGSIVISKVWSHIVTARERVASA